MSAEREREREKWVGAADGRVIRLIRQRPPPSLFVNVFLFTNYDRSNYYVYMSGGGSILYKTLGCRPDGQPTCNTQNAMCCRRVNDDVLPFHPPLFLGSPADGHGRTDTDEMNASCLMIKFNCVSDVYLLYTLDYV